MSDLALVLLIWEGRGRRYMDMKLSHCCELLKCHRSNAIVELPGDPKVPLKSEDINIIW